MKIPVLVYVILFLGSFFIGSLGVAPVLEVDSTLGKIPYMILIIVGYIALTVFFIFWYRGDLERIINQYFKKKQENDIEESVEVQENDSEIHESIDLKEIDPTVEQSIDLKELDPTIEQSGEEIEENRRERGNV